MVSKFITYKSISFHTKAFMAAKPRFIFWQTFLYGFVVLFLSVNASAQKPTITPEYQSKIISKITSELENRYVFPEKASQINKRVEQLEKEGHFKDFTDLDSFAKELSEIIYTAGKDKHISVTLKTEAENNEDKGAADPFESWLDSRLEERSYFRKFNANFKTIEKKKGNIGYLDLRGFYGLDFGRDFANYAMAMLATSDAIIIDLRNNSGGRGDMVDYLLSFFFDKQIITGKSIKRRGNEFVERTNKTPKRDAFSTMPDIPLFVLTSSKTFSAAEAFSYPLKVYKRATFVGQLTKGGANAGDLISLDENLQIFIPDVAGLPHPVSNEIFEGKGIEPDVKIESGKALEKALELAREVALKHKSKTQAEARELLLQLNEIVAGYDGKNEDAIVDFYVKCRRKNLVFEQWELNQLGQQLTPTNPKTALAIYKTAAVIYSESSSAQHIYAKALVKENREKEAITYLKKAVEIAKKNNEDSLKTYEQDLANILGQ